MAAEGEEGRTAQRPRHARDMVKAKSSKERKQRKKDAFNQKLEKAKTEALKAKAAIGKVRAAYLARAPPPLRSLSFPFPFIPRADVLGFRLPRML